MTAILSIGFLVLGIFQWFAIMDGLALWFGISGIFAFFLSIFITYIPIVGTIAGFKGAMVVWGWDFASAGVLFFGPLIVMIIIAVIGGIFSGK